MRRGDQFDAFEDFIRLGRAAAIELPAVRVDPPRNVIEIEAVPSARGTNPRREELKDLDVRVVRPIRQRVVQRRDDLVPKLLLGVVRARQDMVFESADESENRPLAGPAAADWSLDAFRRARSATAQIYPRLTCHLPECDFTTAATADGGRSSSRTTLLE